MCQGKRILVSGEGDNSLMLPAIAFIMNFRQTDPDTGKTYFANKRFNTGREKPNLFLT